MSISVYKVEISDGISELIQNTSSIAYCSKVSKSKDIDKINVDKILEKSNANIGDYDLYYIDSILVSTGQNSNDDVFDPVITWGARKTPIDKQLNFMHNESCILGHIISSTVVDRSGEVIPDNSPIDDIPNNYDIITGSVLYRIWSKDENKELINNVIEKIENSEIFVSMECLFKDFDYALTSESNEQIIISRNKETAFLTKYLKSYGGDGVYKNSRIGRLLKSFVFSGKGLVDKPANSRSIIFNDTKPFNHKTVAYSYFKEEINNMADEKKETDELKSVIAKLEADMVIVKKDLEASNASVSLMATTNTTITTERDNLISDKILLTKELDTLNASLTETKKTLDKTVTDLSIVKAEKIKVERISKLVASNIEKVDADKIVAKWSTLTDEQFEEIVKLHAAKKSVEKDDKDDDDADDAEATANKALAEVKLENTLVPVLPEIKPETQKAVASWLRKSILKTTAHSKDEEN